MILHQLDYARARATIVMLEARCDRLRRRVADPRAAESAMNEVARVEKRIEDLKAQMRNYLDLVTKKSRQSNIFLSFIDIPDQLIGRRLSLGWSQDDLASAVKQHRQIISRYEVTRYASASLKRLIAIDLVMTAEEIKRFGNSTENLNQLRQ